MTQDIKAHIHVLLATFLVGGSFIVSKELSGVIDPISITLLRFILASAILAPFIFMIKKYREKIADSFKRALIISFFYTSFFIGMFVALEYTNALNTSAIYTLVPLLTGIFSIFVFKQRISSKQYFVYLLGIIGTLIVIFKGEVELLLSVSLNQGDVIFLFSIIFMSLYSISAKYFYKDDDVLLTMVFMTLIGGCIWMTLALILFDVPLEWTKLNLENFFHLSYLSIGTTLLTVYLYQSGNIVLGPKKVMSYVYISPACVALLSYIIYGTKIVPIVFLGILFSAFATIVLLRSK